ncbi:MAG: phage tail protein I [Lachnospiraceae bacterium]|nr:phage tail protein I [Lachnospiraceae bacterium]
MPQGRIYTIKNSLLKRACLTGFELEASSLLFRENFSGKKSCYLTALDSGVLNCLWGRLHVQGTFEGRLNLSIRIMAQNETIVTMQDKNYDINEFLTDENREEAEKEDLFTRLGGILAENKTDCLLYELMGRYLWISITVEGTGCGLIESIKVYQKGDNFMDTFPEVYQERNSFFHRYMSIFSSIYNDFQWDIEHISSLFNPDTSPAFLLPVFAEWMGVDVKGDFLEEVTLRTLVKEAYSLNRIKGTRKALERITEIVLGEKAVILEKSKMEMYKKKGVKESFDIIILVKTEVEQDRRVKLKFLFEQFKLVRCSMKILFLSKGTVMDAHTYLDMNAVIEDGERGYFDRGQTYWNIRMN